MNPKKKTKLSSSGIVSISGEATKYTFTPRSPGDYELRVSIPGSNSYVSRSFYSWGAWGGDNSSFQVNNEGHIDISLDKDELLHRRNVSALFKTPFDGRMLITMETDKVISYQYVDVDKRQAHVSLPLTADDIPNVYITATLIKPHELSDIPLTVAHGFQSVKVEAKNVTWRWRLKHRPPSAPIPTRRSPSRRSPGSMITLAAVDNGVLQVTDFTTPDPYTPFLCKTGARGHRLRPLSPPVPRNKGRPQQHRRRWRSEETGQPHARQTDQDFLLLERYRPGQRQRRSQL
jgi:uncharacterized protein YfaS (alpha-2-macroglobulin family)